MNSCFSTMNTMMEYWTESTARCIKYSPLSMAMSFWTDGTAEKIYSSYKNAMSESILKLYRMPGFAASSWEMQKSMAGPWKLFVSMAEQSMKAMNIPTSDDYEELSKRCDYLEDRQRDLKAQLRDSDPGEERSQSPAKISMETSEAPAAEGGTKEEPAAAETKKRTKRRR